MKGRQTLTLASESVAEALADYLNKHLREERAVVVDSWTVMPSGTGQAKVLDCQFREVGKLSDVGRSGVSLAPESIGEPLLPAGAVI